MKVKFLTVIWGARYIDEFARFSLPSYLAPGNLPYVARETELEIVILTSRQGQSHFSTLPIMEKLNALCPVRFILIDDLITTGVYGVTLTLAYARGIMDSGPEQTSTYFLFMNSDFVLADGSLRAAMAKLREGYPCLMAPSLRASAESTLPSFSRALSADGHVLTMLPREMVQLTFDNLHPTVLAKTVTQHFVNCGTHNQIYWQVDETTLLGRYHLIFMLAIKPEVPMGRVNSYCDYGFVPELVPSGNLGFLNDSDDFFMMELQPYAQEQRLLRCGAKSPAEIATELSRWTTREHRRCAEIDMIFRGGVGGVGLEEARAAAARFISDLQPRMKLPAVSHVDHYYWVAGLQTWASLKFAGRTEVTLPPEVRDRPEPQRKQPSLIDPTGWYSAFIGAVRRYIGMIPDVPVWHHLWLDSRLILDWINEVRSAAPSRVLLICGGDSPLSEYLPNQLPVDIRGMGEEQGTPQLAAKEYDRVLIHIDRARVRELRRWLAVADRYVGANGAIAIFIEHKNSELDYSNFSSELSHYAGEILPLNWLGYRLDGRFAGGRLKRRLRQAERSLYRFLWPASLGRLPFMLLGSAGWFVIAILTALNNLYGRKLSSRCPDYCSSALLSLSRRNEALSDHGDSASPSYRTSVGHALPEGIES
jgi:hypothetical protein